MHRYFQGVSFIIFLGLLIGCNNPVAESEQDVYVNHVQFPCGIPRVVDSTVDSEDFLYDHYLTGDGLFFDFRFNCVCSSMFQDSVVVQGNNIFIALKDTATVHARCICEHQSVFQFDYMDYETIHLELWVQFYTQDNYIECVDTTLSIWD